MPLTAAGRLPLRIGALEDRIARLCADLAEDAAILALLHDGTAGCGEARSIRPHAGTAPPPPAGWADEDECAAFVAASERKLTELLGELDVLYGQYGELLAAEARAA